MDKNELADRIVEAIVVDLTGRAGFDYIWDSLDEDTAKNIQATWLRMVQQELCPDAVEPIVMFWDWKESVGQIVEELEEAIEAMPGPVFAYRHDTRSDDYCFVLSPRPMSPEEVAEAFEHRYDDEED